MAYFGTNRSCRSSIVEHHPCHPGHQPPTSDCYYWEANGAINEAFSETSLNLSTKIPASSYSHLYQHQQQLPQPSPSLFCVDDSSNWMDKSINPGLNNSQPHRYMEHWLDLEDSLNPVDGYNKRYRQPSSYSSTNSPRSFCCHCQKLCFYCVPLIVTLSLFGLIIIIATIIYLETYARQVDYSSNEYTSGRRPFDLRSSNSNLIY